MKKLFLIIILINYLATNLIGLNPVYAQEFVLPSPGRMVYLSPVSQPPILKGIKINPENPFHFDFILERGDSQISNDALKAESSKLIKYFFASLIVPENDLWVNLSPYEKDRIIPSSFSLTQMGRDLLAEDYMLKQITASLIYPDGETGIRFWQRIYAQAAKRFGTTNIPVNTFNKVWIVPEQAIVYENAKDSTAYVLTSKLKVMLEQDYLSLEKHEGIQFVSTGIKDTNQLGSQIVREIVIPELTKEVNEDKNFAQLRQAYNSLILAIWYKKCIKDSILEQMYAGMNKVAGVNIDDPKENQRIYERYLQAFRKGVYNYIKEEIDPVSHQITTRKYFSGGIKCNMAMMHIYSMPRDYRPRQTGLEQLTVNLDPAMSTSVVSLSLVRHGYKIGMDLDESVKAKYERDFMRLIRNTPLGNEIDWLELYSYKLDSNDGVIEISSQVHLKNNKTYTASKIFIDYKNHKIIKFGLNLEADVRIQRIFGEQLFAALLVWATHVLRSENKFGNGLDELVTSNVEDKKGGNPGRFFMYLFDIWRNENLNPSVVEETRNTFLEKPKNFILPLRLLDFSRILASIKKPAMKDEAMNSRAMGKERIKYIKGGIDLSFAHSIWQAHNFDKTIKFHIDDVQVSQLQNASSFVPVIINIQPIKDIRFWLGLIS